MVSVEVRVNALYFAGIISIYVRECVYYQRSSISVATFKCSILLYVSVFALSAGFEFPIDFIPIVRRIFRTYFAILAHIYHHHFHDIRALDLHDGLNSLFLHFVYFVQEFSLVETKEMQCVEELIQKLIHLDQEMARHPSTDDFLETAKTIAQQQHHETD